MKKPGKHTLKLIGSIFTVLCIVYIAFVLSRMDVDWSMLFSKRSNITALLGLCGLSFIQYVLFATAWWIMLCLTSKRKLPFRPVFGVYSKSNLAKYLPGNVMHLAGRNLLGSQLDITQADIAMATVLDLAMTVITALAMSVVLSFDYLVQTIKIIVSNRGFLTTFVILGVIGCVGIVVLGVVIKKNNKVKTYFSRLEMKNVITACLKSAGIYCLLFSILGVINLLILTKIVGVSTSAQNAVSFVGLTIISWTAGFIVPGAPGGLGIREAIMLWLMAPLFGKEQVAISAVLLRIVNVAGDVLIFVASIIWDRISERKGE